jgi:hypothetical protein
MTELPDVIYAGIYHDDVPLKEWRETKMTGSTKYIRADAIPHVSIDIDAIHAKPKDGEACLDCGSEMRLVCSGLEKMVKKEDAGKCVVGTKYEPRGRALSQPLPSPDPVKQLLREALAELVELQSSALAVKMRSECITDTWCDADVKILYERVGYGAVMDSAARQWFIKDGKGGSHTTYHCYSVVKQVTERAQEALAASEVQP